MRSKQKERHMPMNESDEELTYGQLRTVVVTFLRFAADQLERTPGDELDYAIERICNSVGMFRSKQKQN
jgi:hypothetical protein